MRYILDTNVLIYLLCAPNALSPEARRIVQSEPDVFVSIASLWEIGIKQSLGKLSLALDVPGIEAQCTDRDIHLLPITSVVIERMKGLPFIHRDPFDRLLVAHAMEEDFVMVTHDGIIPQYPVKTMW